VTLVLIQVIVQSILSTLHWIGFYVGIRMLRPESKAARAFATHAIAS
jgi:hypothetical protein